MEPASPVMPGGRIREVTYAKNQPEYLPLPAIRFGDPREGRILTRWSMTWRERLRVLFGGSVYVQVMTFNQPLQPLLISVAPPENAE